MPDVITSRNNSKVASAFALKKDGSPSSFLIEGHHLCQMAYLLGCLDEIFALEDPKYDNVTTHLVNESIIEKLATSKSPEGIVGIAHLKEKAPNQDLVLVLDRLQDPGNVGTLMRTALSFGFKEVHFLPGTCSPLNPKSIAASQGAIFALKYVFAHSEEEEIENLKSSGYHVYGSALNNAKKLEGYEFPKGKIALILGNEGRGMSEYLLYSTECNLKISMDSIDSLNVGVAGGILMHKIGIENKQ